MLPEQYTYWLKGFFEISDTNNLSEKQVQIIRDHLDLVFNKVTPERSEKSPYEQLFDSIVVKPTHKKPELYC